MSTAIARNFQIGIDPTPTNNFTLYQPATPDGTLRLGNGNTGITSSLLTLSSAGQLSFVAGSAAAPTLSPSGDSNTGIFFPAADTIAFAEGGVEAMRLDAAGNLGLGVTPSPNNIARTFELQSGFNMFGYANLGYINANAYFNSGWLYKNTAAAGRYEVGDAHKWFTAPSGTAGNAISFTQAMTLNANNSLLLGTTTPAYETSNRNVMTIGATTSSMLALQTGGTNRGYLYADNTTFAIEVENPQQLKLNTIGANPIVFFTSNTERARIDSSGNLLVGRSSSTGVSRIGVAGNSDNTTGINLSYQGVGEGLIRVVSSNALTFGYDGANGATERMRIDSSGNLLVGRTSQLSTERFAVYTASQSWAMSIENARNTSADLGAYISLGSNTNNTGSFFVACITAGFGARIELRGNGGIANFQANNVNLSDRREKTNFAPAGEYLSKICAIPVQTFNYIDQSEDDPGLTLGVVAQDVQAVAPELVMESDWSAEKDGSKMRLSIYQTDLQYALMKALQELKAEFDAYKATHP